MPEGRRFRFLSYGVPTPIACSADDWMLVSRLAADERAAVSEVYRDHHSALRAFAQRITGDAAAAEDLVHDVFVQLPALARKFRGQSQFSTFITGVAARLGERYVRSAMRRRAHLARLATLAPAPDDDGLQADPAFAGAIQRALDALPIPQRMAFVLCEVEERSAEEAAQVLGIPVATVRTRCFHARRKLRERLERSHPELSSNSSKRESTA